MLKNLILLSGLIGSGIPGQAQEIFMGAWVRGPVETKKIALVFTGDEFSDGGFPIVKALNKKNIKASFFFTGRFYANPDHSILIKKLKQKNHYLGGHSDQHLLYCDWGNRDKLLITNSQFKNDLTKNYERMSNFKIQKKDAPYFLPPYEWYNDSISIWTSQMGLQLINYTSGTLSHADYTTPDMKNYRSSDEILASIFKKENERPNGLNGFILLLHIGTDPRRKDKLYNHLSHLIETLSKKGYEWVKITQLFNPNTSSFSK